MVFVFSGAKQDKDGVMFLLKFKEGPKVIGFNEAKSFAAPIITYLETKIVFEAGDNSVAGKAPDSKQRLTARERKVICKC